MAKRSKKQVTGNHMDHSGCIQGLINIFHFHHGHTSQKLLADKRQRSKRITGAVDNINGLNTTDAFCDMCKVEEVVEPRETTATREKMSVKELMESEMFERDRLRRMNKSEGGSSQTAPGQHGQLGRTNHHHAKKNSLDLCDFSIISEKPVHRKHKSLSSLDFGGMVTDLCTQISVEGVCHLHHDQTNEESSLPSKDAMEESLAEATRVFVNHFIDRKNFMKDGKIQHPRELIDAIQLLNCNKDVFLKLLKDPTSQLVKHMQKLEDHQADEDEKSRVKLGSASNEVEQRKHKHHGFFWRKLKGFERNLSMKQHDNPQSASTIIVLKPGPSSSLQSSRLLGNNVQSERTSTYVIFNEFKRKLKHAIRKKHPSLGDSDKAIDREGLFTASPSRDHYFIEKLPRKTISPKKQDRAVRMYEATTSMSDEQISTVDAEAKRTLAEIIGIGDVDVKSISRQVPNSLEGIRSCSDYSHTPICSPRKDEERSLLTSPRILSPCEGSQFADDRKLCSTIGKIGDDIHLKSSDVSDDCNPDADKSVHSTDSEVLSKDDVENARAADAAMDLNKRLYLDDTVTGSCNTSRNVLAEETCHDNEENQIMCSNSDFVRENELSSPLTSSADRSEWVSSASVRGPILKDDGVSQSIKSFPVLESIQPRKTEIEEHNLPSSDCLKAWEEERKSVSEFVKDVVRVTHLTRSQLLERFLFAEHLLEPSLFDELDFLPDYCCHDPELLFDLIKEVITEVCENDFHGIPSFFKPYMRLNLKEENIVDEVWEGVDWHLQSEMTQWTLDQAVAKDVSNSLPWMDLRLDCESIGIEMGEEILEELIEEAILGCISLVHDGAGPSLSEPGEVERSPIV